MLARRINRKLKRIVSDYNPIVKTKPTRLYIELTNRCNLNCPFCLVGQQNLQESLRRELRCVGCGLVYFEVINYNGNEMPLSYFGSVSFKLGNQKRWGWGSFMADIAEHFHTGDKMSSIIKKNKSIYNQFNLSKLTVPIPPFVNLATLSASKFQPSAHGRKIDIFSGSIVCFQGEFSPFSKSQLSPVSNR